MIQTGAIAGVAFVVGDYAAELLPLGPFGSALYAAIAIVIFTGVNVIGTAQGKTLQIAMTLIEVGAVMAIIVFGFLGSAEPAPVPTPMEPGGAAFGMALILVLLTYGGWNEAVRLTGELEDAPRNIAKVLAAGTAILVTLYVLANVAQLSILGLDGLRGSDAVAAELKLTQTYQMLTGELVQGGKSLPISDAKMDGTQIAFTAGGQRYTGQTAGGQSWSATRSAS